MNHAAPGLLTIAQTDSPASRACAGTRRVAGRANRAAGDWSTVSVSARSVRPTLFVKRAAIKANPAANSEMVAWETPYSVKTARAADGQMKTVR